MRKKERFVLGKRTFRSQKSKHFVLRIINKCVNEGNVPKSSQDENYREARRAFLIGYDRSVPKLRQASHCTGCNQCNPHCPQGIDIPKKLQEIDLFVENLKQERL